MKQRKSFDSNSVATPRGGGSKDFWTNPDIFTLYTRDPFLTYRYYVRACITDYLHKSLKDHTFQQSRNSLSI